VIGSYPSGSGSTPTSWTVDFSVGNTTNLAYVVCAN
jgi:hypothetical protein